MFIRAWNIGFHVVLRPFSLCLAIAVIAHKTLKCSSINDMEVNPQTQQRKILGLEQVMGLFYLEPR